MSNPDTMRAMAYDGYGDPDVLRLTDLPRPKVGPGEVLIRVRSAAVNPVDWKIMSGGLDALMDIRFPVVPGWDVAGVVEQLGLDVPELTVGDEVMAYARKDYVHGGTFAELVTVPVRARPQAASLSWDEAAGLPFAGLTAYQVLSRLDVSEDTVLVHGAAGGVGALGVQIARSLGARVIGTASPANHDWVRALGAQPVAYGDGLAERVRALAPDGVTSWPTSWAGSSTSRSPCSPRAAGTRRWPTRGAAGRRPVDVGATGRGGPGPAGRARRRGPAARAGRGDLPAGEAGRGVPGQRRRARARQAGGARHHRRLTAPALARR